MEILRCCPYKQFVDQFLLDSSNTYEAQLTLWQTHWYNKAKPQTYRQMLQKYSAEHTEGGVTDNFLNFWNNNLIGRACGGVPVDRV